MTNYEIFIHNLKKKRNKNLLLAIVVLIIFAIFCYYMSKDYTMPLASLVVGIILFINYLYTIHKISNLKNNLTKEEQQTLERELENIVFEGLDYALTDNYIIDYKKIKMIPFNSITAIKREKSTDLGSHNITIQTKVKIWTESGVYTYISGEKSTSIQLNAFKPYYNDLCNYIKQKNQNIEEK